MFPDLPQDTIQAVLSGLFQVDPHVSREDLANRAVAALLEMSKAAEPERPRAITSFGPAATDTNGASSGGSEAAGSGGGADSTPEGPCGVGSPDGGDPDQALDEYLAELLALPDQELHACATTLANILARIAESPGEARVRRLRLANARFEAQVARHACGLGLLRLAGFEDATEDGEPVVAFYGDPLADGGGFGKVQESLEGVVEDLGLLRPQPASAGPRAPDMAGRRNARGDSVADPSPRGRAPALADRRRRVAELTEERLKDPRAFREAAQRRGAGNRAVGQALRPRQAAVPVAAPGRRAQHFTLADVEQMRIADEIASMPGYAAEYGAAGGRYDPGLIARQAIDGTNAYRASKGLPPLGWNDGIAEIARRHAEQMARGAMPFSHDGFNQRVFAFPVLHRSAGENLALNKGVAEVAKTAVDGWIKSPGHEKNLRGSFNLCGIGVACSSDGTFYLTQLFANAM